MQTFTPLTVEWRLSKARKNASDKGMRQRKGILISIPVAVIKYADQINIRRKNLGWLIVDDTAYLDSEVKAARA